MMNPDLISTDIQERWGFDFQFPEYVPYEDPIVLIQQEKLKITQHWMKKPGEWYPGPVRKGWLVLHHTAGWDYEGQTIDIWERDTRGPVAVEFVIGGQCIDGIRKVHDGAVAQAFAHGGYGWHWSVGNIPMHRESVAVEICCFGPLTNGRTYTGAEVAPDQIVNLQFPFRGYTQYHRISDEQVQILRQLTYYIADRDNIDIRAGLPTKLKDLSAKKGIKGVYEAFDFCDPIEIAKTPGTWTHANVTRQKSDLFPQPEIVEMLLSL